MMARPNRNPKHRQTALIDAQRVIKDAMFSAIMVRDGGCCVWCHRRVERIRVRAGHCPPHMATLDHVIPQADGGAFARVNLVLACNACNTARGRTPALVYAERRGVVLPAEVVAMLRARVAA